MLMTIDFSSFIERINVLKLKESNLLGRPQDPNNCFRNYSVDKT